MMMNNYPNNLINLLSDEQRRVFLKLLNKKNSTNIDLLKELNKLISSFGGFFSEQKSYKQILEKICEKRRIKNIYSNSVYETEQLILENKFNTIYNSLNKEDKRKFDEEIQMIALQRGLSLDQAKSISAIGTLAGANIAGFGLYIMASTFVGGLTSAIGLTLPFAFYTGMSSALSIVTGPIGWIAGLGYVAYTFRNDNIETAQAKLKNTATGFKTVFTGNVEHCEILVSQICSFRIMLQQEFENEILKNEYKISEINTMLPDLISRKEELNQELSKITRSLTQIKNEIEIAENSNTNNKNRIADLKLKLNSIQ